MSIHTSVCVKVVSGPYFSNDESSEVLTSHIDCLWPDNLSWLWLKPFSKFKVSGRKKCIIPVYVLSCNKKLVEAKCWHKDSLQLALTLSIGHLFKVTVRKLVHPLLSDRKILRDIIYLAGVSFVKLLTIPLIFNCGSPSKKTTKSLTACLGSFFS